VDEPGRRRDRAHLVDSALEAGSPPSYAGQAALISHSKTLAVALAPLESA
jgi:hypothetical protein